MLKISNLPWPSEGGIGFLYPCHSLHTMVAQVEKGGEGFCLYLPSPQ